MNRAMLFAPATLLALQAGVAEIHAAQVDYFLKLDGITGESTDSQHKGWFQIESFSFGLAQTGTQSSGSGGGAGKVTFNPFSITRKTDAASPNLFLHCATGEHIRTGTLQVVRKAGGEQLKLDQAASVVLTINFTDLDISSYQTGGSGDVPLDALQLLSAHVAFVSDKSSDTTTIDTGWDVTTNTEN